MIIRERVSEYYLKLYPLMIIIFLFTFPWFNNFLLADLLILFISSSLSLAVKLCKQSSHLFHFISSQMLNFISSKPWISSKIHQNNQKHLKQFEMGQNFIRDGTWGLLFQFTYQYVIFYPFWEQNGIQNYSSNIAYIENQLVYWCFGLIIKS